MVLKVRDIFENLRLFWEEKYIEGEIRGKKQQMIAYFKSMAIKGNAQVEKDEALKSTRVKYVVNTNTALIKV